MAKGLGFIKGTKKKIILISLIVLLVLLAAIILYRKTCDNISCFNTYLEGCRKATYIDDAQDSTWKYTILWRSGESCAVEVKVLAVKEGSVGIERLEGKDMTCYIPLEAKVDPKADLEKCHGILKEEIQNLIIQKMHSYILENVGRVSEELRQVI